jgi:hypothetical protein
VCCFGIIRGPDSHRCLSELSAAVVVRSFGRQIQLKGPAGSLDPVPLWDFEFQSETRAEKKRCLKYIA